MKVAIVGSRSFNNYDIAKKVLSEMIQPEDIIVSGGAKGADTLAEKFAKEFENDVIIHKPQWDRYGKEAGIIRNGKIIEDCDYVIAFWDGKSRGTGNTIQRAKNVNKQVIQIDVTNFVE